MDNVAVVLVVLIVCCILCLLKRSAETFDETIFISAASYRDEECLNTVKDAFAKASRPERVRVGICQQNKEKREDCVGGIDARWAGQVRSVSLKHTEAKGPTWARYLCSTLYGGEDFFLQIDSHTRFVQGWDTMLIEDIRKCPTDKAILTHYPQSYDIDEKTLHEQVPVMCKSKWNSEGLPSFEAIMKPSKQAGLRRVPFAAGGMIFADAKILHEIPFDPNLAFVFVGEEILLSARFFTHGWDLYTPTRNVLLHHYERKEGPRFWQDLKGYRTKQMASVQRVKQLLGLQEPDISLTDQYGMGKERSLKDFWRFARLDPDNKTSDSQEYFCRDV